MMKNMGFGAIGFMFALLSTNALSQPGEIAPGNAEERTQAPFAPGAAGKGWESGAAGTHGAPGALTDETGLQGKHSMMGTVQDIDRQKGLVTLSTAPGPLKLHFPPGSLQKLKKGDRIQVNLSFTAVQNGR